MKLIFLNKKNNISLTPFDVIRSLPILTCETYPIVSNVKTDIVESITPAICPTLNYLPKENDIIMNVYLLRTFERLKGEIDFNNMKYVANGDKLEISPKTVSHFPAFSYSERVVNLKYSYLQLKSENNDLREYKYFVGMNNALRKGIEWLDVLYGKVKLNGIDDVYNFALKNNDNSLNINQIRDFSELYLTVKLILSVNSPIVDKQYGTKSFNRFFKWLFVTFLNRNTVIKENWSGITHILHRYQKLIGNENFNDELLYGSLLEKLKGYGVDIENKVFF